jgi:hypothetical protein
MQDWRNAWPPASTSSTWLYNPIPATCRTNDPLFSSILGLNATGVVAFWGSLDAPTAFQYR